MDCAPEVFQTIKDTPLVFLLLGQMFIIIALLKLLRKNGNK